jgi:hypothetical protein
MQEQKLHKGVWTSWNSLYGPSNQKFQIQPDLQMIWSYGRVCGDSLNEGHHFSRACPLGHLGWTACPLCSRRSNCKYLQTLVCLFVCLFSSSQQCSQHFAGLCWLANWNWQSSVCNWHCIGLSEEYILYYIAVIVNISRQNASLNCCVSKWRFLSVLINGFKNVCS